MSDEGLCFEGIHSRFDAKEDGYVNPTRILLRPGDKVYGYDTYFEVAPIEPYTVVRMAGETVITEVKRENRHCYRDIIGWLGSEKPDVMRRYNLSSDKRYWFFEWVKPVKKGMRGFIDIE